MAIANSHYSIRRLIEWQSKVDENVFVRQDHAEFVRSTGPGTAIILPAL